MQTFIGSTITKVFSSQPTSSISLQHRKYSYRDQVQTIWYDFFSQFNDHSINFYGKCFTSNNNDNNNDNDNSNNDNNNNNNNNNKTNDNNNNSEALNIKRLS